MSDLTLYIGNKCFSSWSLRPWMVLKMAGIPFREEVIRLRQPETKANILKVSPHGKVPLLVHGSVKVWESLAILDYVADAFPQANLWPADLAARGMARSVAAEMHGGFADVRNQWGMNLRKPRTDKTLEGAAVAQGQRIEAIWEECRANYGAGGPFLFGQFSCADAMYAPVVSRFHTFGGELAPVTRAYCDAMLATSAMREWMAGAAQETWPEPDPYE
ncbi:MAG: glutathione S-transferase family protein [Aestuariivirgaceae bacterium]|nr:glutathione S-transferase family protein [Aestuariivirgaceae bacterium]